VSADYTHDALVVMAARLVGVIVRNDNLNSAP
jgi:hypothetical protein